MLNLPTAIMTLLQPFRPVFHASTWNKVQVLVIGTILTPGRRTVCAALRVMGLSESAVFSQYHQVLNRAAWSSHQASRVLLTLLLTILGAGRGPLVFGLDETIERRWGRQIKARGIYRDAVRSSQSHFVKTRGLRWLVLAWLTPIPWAQRIWALPFLTVLAPSTRYYADKVRRPKHLTDWARQMICQLRRWLPQHDLVVVGDAGYAVLELLHACRQLARPVTFVTRLRLAAALYEPAPPYGGCGRPRKKAGAPRARLPTLRAMLTAQTTAWRQQAIPWYQGTRYALEIASDTAVWYHTGKPPVPIRWVLIRDPQAVYAPVALLSTDPNARPEQIVTWFVRRWSIEVTLEEARRHLGVETQRQWSDLAILRSTPALLGLFSWITLVAHHLQQTQSLPVAQTTWYAKSLPTFGDALAWVRHLLWSSPATFYMSPSHPDVVKVPRPLFDRLINVLCYSP